MTTDIAASQRHTDEALHTLMESAAVTALAGRSVTIYGCTGLLGAAVVQVLTTANRERRLAIRITGIARNPPVHTLPADTGFRFLQGSVSSDEVSAEPPPDYSIYIAGAASDYLERASEVIDSQIVGLDRLLARSKGRRVCFISSARVYGRQSTDRPLTEADAAAVTPMHLDNIYDSSKRLGESLCLWHSRFAGCEAMAVRLPNLYGPQDVVRSQTAFTSFVQQAYTDRIIRLTGNTASIRNYAHVLDAAQGILRALTHGNSGEAYNIGSEEHLSVAEYAAVVADSLPFPVEVISPIDPPAPNHQVMSITKAGAALGFLPVTRLADAAPYAIQKTARAMGFVV